MTVAKFALGTILTVTTGRLLTKSEGPNDNGIGDLHRLLGHMTGDEPFTHTLGRFADECKPWLLRWFPELQNAENNLGVLDKSITAVRAANRDVRDACSNWLELCVADWGMKREYDVGQIPAEDHEIKNPLVELAEMRKGSK